MHSRLLAPVLAFAALLPTTAQSVLSAPAPAAAAVGGAASSAAPVERPSIMQAQDRAHQGQLFVDSPRALPAHPYVAPRRAMAAGPASAPKSPSFYNPGGLTREVLGFAPYWALSSGGLSDIQYDKVSSLTYFGLTFDGTGNVVGDSGYSGWTSAAMNTMVSQAHAAGDKMLATFKAFNDNDILGITYNGNYLANSYNNIKSALDQKGLDGVNIDFEGSTVGMPSDFQQHFTNYIAGLRKFFNENRPGTILTVDTYSGAASWDQGFMRIDALAPSVDYFFIMAYDMTMPADAPNAPLAGPYTYTDTSSVDQYLSKVGGDGSKVTLGVPYYGYKFSTTNTSFQAPIVGGTGALADSYSNIESEFSCAQQLQKNWDAASSTPWMSWWSPASGDPCGGNYGQLRELYYDDATSLGAKYDLVNNRNIRGAGMWALGYDHGTTALWKAIGTKFQCAALQISAIAPASGTTGTQVSITGCGFLKDNTNHIPTVTFAGTPATVTYVSQTQVLATAPAHSLGAVDVTLTNPAGGGSVNRTGGFTYAANGYTLDGWGGVHQYGGAPAIADGSHAYWPGWDIARSIAVCPGGQSGYTLDGWGGIHAFGNVPAVGDGSHTYWPGWDIARGIALSSCSPSAVQGYIVDGYGGLHGFGSPSAPPAIADGSQGFYWSGWNIARGISMCPTGSGGYVLDGWGGVHAFGGAPAIADGSHAYWMNWDIARSIVVTACGAGTSAGYTLDGWGGVHAFGSATPVADSSHAYWFNWDIARSIGSG
jgi:spore germination protein YaaH